MKKMIGVLTVLAFVGSVCYAQETVKSSSTSTAAKLSSVASDTKTVVGKVASVVVADPAKGIASGAITVVDAAGKTTNFTVSSVVKVLDNTYKAIALNQLRMGETVKVKGKKSAAGEEAQSITVLK